MTAYHSLSHQSYTTTWQRRSGDNFLSHYSFRRTASCQLSGSTALKSITLDNQYNVLFIDVSASCRKPSSGLTSGISLQYVKSCPIRGSIGSSLRLDSCCQSVFLIHIASLMCLPALSDLSVWDKVLRTDDRYRTSVQMKAILCFFQQCRLFHLFA